MNLCIINARFNDLEHERYQSTTSEKIESSIDYIYDLMKSMTAKNIVVMKHTIQSNNDKVQAQIENIKKQL